MISCWTVGFLLTPPLNRGAYPESRGDFWGTIWGYDSPILEPPLGTVYWWTQKSGYRIFGVRFLLLDWVMSPAIFFSEASVFKRLASPKKLYLEESHPPLQRENNCAIVRVSEE